VTSAVRKLRVPMVLARRSLLSRRGAAAGVGLLLNVTSAFSASYTDLKPAATPPNIRADYFSIQMVIARTMTGPRVFKKLRFSFVTKLCAPR
jgi:hypothetical protein